MIELFYRICIKHILGARYSTASCMIYAETGKLPLRAQIKKRMIGFWAALMSSNQPKLSTTAARLGMILFESGSLKSEWMRTIKHTLDCTGFGYLFSSDNTMVVPRTVRRINQRIDDITTQEILTSLNESSRCRLYSKLKQDVRMETYLFNLNASDARSVVKVRLGNLKVPTNSFKKVPVTVCPLCLDHTISNECHFALDCPVLADIRVSLPPNLIDNDNTSTRKYASLFNRGTKYPGVVKFLRALAGVVANGFYAGLG